MFESVDWRVLGLLLGIADEKLERIQNEFGSSLVQCQQSMIKQWISTGQCYWSSLLETLKGPVLGEVALANSLDKKHQITPNRDITATPTEGKCYIFLISDCIELKGNCVD